jgi:hypothetical protein
MKTLQVKGQTKYWTNKASADRARRTLAMNGFTTPWVVAWELDKGWFLENLDELEIHNDKVDA